MFSEPVKTNKQRLVKSLPKETFWWPCITHELKVSKTKNGSVVDNTVDNAGG